MAIKVNSTTRPSPIAGQWYPANPNVLAASVDKAIADARLPVIKGKVIAIMAPHAGHRYSGPVAGYAFASLRGLNPDIVAVISPMHQPYPYPLMTTSHRAYATPLGEIPVDHQTLQSLDDIMLQELGFGLTAVAHDPEHSLEIEIPFLQRALEKEFVLLPVMVREQTSKVVHTLGRALAQVLQDRQALLVASTDLSHFYPQHLAETLDKELLRRFETFDPESVLRAEDEGQGFACGRGALAAVMWAAKYLGADTASVLHYATSGDVTGDYTQVVGYGAGVMTRKLGS